MAKRVPLTENSFLAHVFSPKKAPLPSGLRKTTLTGLKGGRTKGRLNAFNKLSPFNQEILKRSGQRDAYLKGETTLVKAKQALRPAAVNLGLAKPVKRRTPAYKPAGGTLTGLDRMIQARFLDKIRDSGRPVNRNTVEKEFVWLDNGTSDMLTWQAAEFRRAGSEGSEYEIIIDGVTHNPFWYH